MYDKEEDDTAVQTLSARHRRRHRHFWSAWMRSPRKMGSVLPSSQALARAMAEQVDPGVGGAVVELGAGTGAVTHALLERIPASRLLVLEREPKLHALLAAHYPGINMVCADALHLGDVLAQQGISEISAIVSSLPLLSMPRAVRQGIVAQMAAAIGEPGRIVQYTYGPKSPLGQAGGLKGRKVKTVLANVPPAQVWVYQRTVDSRQ